MALVLPRRSRVDPIWAIVVLDNPWEHPAWSYIRSLVGPVEGSLSVTPEQTKADIIVWSPLLTLSWRFISSTVGVRRFLLLSILSYLVAAVAAISLCQFLLAPMTVGFETKTAYIGSLTGFYINRNSALAPILTSVSLSMPVCWVSTCTGKPQGPCQQGLEPRSPDQCGKSDVLYDGWSAHGRIGARGYPVAWCNGVGLHRADLSRVALQWRKRRRRRSAPRSIARGWRLALIVSLMSTAAVVVAQKRSPRRGLNRSIRHGCAHFHRRRRRCETISRLARFRQFPGCVPAYRSPQCSGIEESGMLPLTPTLRERLGWASFSWSF